jgi:hypothetical protein
MVFSMASVVKTKVLSNDFTDDTSFPDKAPLLVTAVSVNLIK